MRTAVRLIRRSLAVRSAVSAPRVAARCFSANIKVNEAPEAHPEAYKGGKAALTTGLAEDMTHKRVRILRPSRNTMQQGWQPDHWAIEFDRSSSAKWVNPLMGWTSSNDTTNQLDLALKFDSKEEAIAFCEKNGLQFEIQEPHEPKKKPKAYADNFKWRKHPPKAE